MRLDRANLFGRRVIEAIPLNGNLRTVVSGQSLQLGPGGSQASAPFGRSLNAGNAGPAASVQLDLSKYSKISIGFWGRVDSYTRSDRFFLEHTGNSQATAGGFYIDPDSGAFGRFDIAAYGTLPGYDTFFDTQFPGQWIWYTVAIDLGKPGGAFALYANGKRVSSTGTFASTGGPTNFANSTLFIGARASGAFPLGGGLSNIVFLEGVVSDAEARAWALNPWQQFAIPDDDVYAIAALGGTTLPISPAALMLAGGNVAMRISRRVPVQPAAIQASGSNVAMRTSRRIALQSAQLQLAGADVALRASRKIGVQPAALAATGGLVDLRAARRVAVSAADLVLQPGKAQLRSTRRLVVAPAVATLTGGAIEFVYTPAESGNSYSIPVAPAALTLTGGDVTMRITRRMPVTAAHLSLDAGQVRLIAARRQLVSPAHLALGGGDVMLRFLAESPPLDISKVHPSRIVMFDGSGSKVVVFEGSGSKVVVFEGSGKRMRFNDMSAKVPIKIGDKWTTDRDRDEVSYYAADITDELADRRTTADEDGVTALVFGVELLEGPQVQVATIDGVERTFVVVKLGDAKGPLPDDWRWVARVPCANGERFDKTTWFNEVDP